MENFELEKPKRTANRVLIILAVCISAIFVAVFLFAFFTVLTRGKDVSLAGPPGWKNDDTHREDQERSLEKKGYKQEIDSRWISADEKRMINLAHYSPQTTDVFRDLPDTRSVEEMEDFISENETSLLEYFETRYSLPAEIKAITLNCGQVALSSTIVFQSTGMAMETLFINRGGTIYCVYISGPPIQSGEGIYLEDEAYVIENLKVR